MNQYSKYGQLHFKKLKKFLGEYQNLPEEDMLHKIRLELKKLKVLFHFIEYCDKDFNATKEFSSLHRIFKKAGRIREIDVFERLMINYNIENINGIPSNMEKAKMIQKFNKKIPQFIEEVRKKEKDLRKHLSKVEDEFYLKYLEEKNKDLKKGVNSSPGLL